MVVISCPDCGSSNIEQRSVETVVSYPNGQYPHKIKWDSDFQDYECLDCGKIW